MLRGIVATVLVVGVAAVAASSASASINRCSDTGPGFNTCFTRTVETKVQFGVVRMGKWSSGHWALICRKGDSIYRASGNLRRGQTATGIIAHPRNANCLLRARARAFNGHPASVRIRLVSKPG